MTGLLGLELQENPATTPACGAGACATLAAASEGIKRPLPGKGMCIALSASTVDFIASAHLLQWNRYQPARNIKVRSSCNAACAKISAPAVPVFLCLTQLNRIAGQGWSRSRKWLAWIDAMEKVGPKSSGCRLFHWPSPIPRLMLFISLESFIKTKRNNKEH